MLRTLFGPNLNSESARLSHLCALSARLEATMSRSRMVLRVDREQPLLLDVRVELRGSDAGVT